jgi:hypothetical protein
MGHAFDPARRAARGPVRRGSRNNFQNRSFFWAGGEVLRGIDPWRRCLGIIVLCYGLWTLPR